MWGNMNMDQFGLTMQCIKYYFFFFLAELKPCAMECTWQDYQGTTERGEKLLCSKALSCAVFVFQCAHFGLKETMNKAGNA